MTEVLEWLLGLERIHLRDDAPLNIRFATPPAPWIMLFGAVIAAFVVFRLYRREVMKDRWRWPLMVLRFGTIMLVLLLFSRPMLVLHRNHVEPSVVPVLLDRSTSMAEQDVAITRHGVPQPHQSRWSAAVWTLLDPDQGLFARILPRHRAELWTFGEEAARHGSVSGPDELALLLGRLEGADPDGPETDIVGGVNTTLERNRSSRVAGVVLVSDGRQTSPSTLDAMLARAKARSVPIHVIAMGSDKARRDIDVISAWAEEDVFVFDTVKIRIRLKIKGFNSPVPMTLEMRDKTTDELLAKQTTTVQGAQEMWRGELQYRPEAVGRRILRIAAVPHADEKNVENNWADVAIRAHDEKLSVLYVEGVPRYEYRYLKNLLLREATFRSSCLLLGATAGFTQEGTHPIQRFPRSVEELGRYDVVIMGDVDPRGDWLSPVQESMLVDFVSSQGGGLAFLAGERNMPHRLRRTKLEKLLPIRIAPNFLGRYETAMENSFTPKLTIEGREHPIFRFEFDRARNDELMSSMPGWYWFASVLGSQPAATVLAVHPSVQSQQGAMPIMVLGRFGAGRTFYLGSDDLWRWRRYSGESYYENTWLQVIRTLARGRKLGTRRSWRLETDRKAYQLGRKVQVELVTGRKAGPHALGETVVLVHDERDALVDRITLTPNEMIRGTWQGEFIPRRTGILALSLEEPVGFAGAESPEHTISVTARDAERDRLESDHAFLRNLAVRSGGSFREMTDDLDELIAGLPDRSERIPDDVEEPLWDTRLILIVFIGLIVTEWIIRKGIGLA
ncbi:MAG: hypothetical protein MI923_01655 [Phycisphaerales bacterium]|nr:hypothetical protein [Phycisphaerales bacterium]